MDLSRTNNIKVIKKFLIKRPSFRRILSILLLLLSTVMVMFNIRIFFRDSIIINAKINQPDFMQIFIPVHGKYTEKNSIRSLDFDSSGNELKFTLPVIPVTHLRIDPANTESEIIISKIQIHYMFKSEILSPVDLITRIKKIQMINKLEVKDDGLHIHSIGNDPVFEFELNQVDWFYLFILFDLIFLMIAIIFYFFIKIRSITLILASSILLVLITYYSILCMLFNICD